MNQEMKVSQDGTINFYHNRKNNLKMVVYDTVGLILGVFLFLLLLRLNLLNKEVAYIALGCVILMYIPIIIFFLIRFFKPKPIIALNDEGIIAPFSLPYSQITIITYEKRNIASLLNSNIDDLAKSTSLRDNCLVFRTKDENAYKFQIDLLTTENKQALRDYLEKKGFTYQG